jgi:outer membrane lipoprotein-sorting protein
MKAAIPWQTIRIALATCLLVPAISLAETPQEKGLAIAQEADRRDQGWGDSRADLKMILSNQHGETSDRELRIRSLEVADPNEGDWSMIVFDQPRDVKGTGLLTYTHITDPDDQWLYLPALKRVKRISSNNKSGPFMGSEFAYEDFSSQEVGKYGYRWLRDEPCGALQCFVIERVPKYAHSGYTRQNVWIDADEYRVHKIEFYDRKDDHRKTMLLTDHREYLDQYWRAHDLFMENHQTGKTTRLVWSDYVFRNGLSESDFTTNSLKRVR